MVDREKEIHTTVEEITLVPQTFAVTSHGYNFYPNSANRAVKEVSHVLCHWYRKSHVSSLSMDRQ